MNCEQTLTDVGMIKKVDGRKGRVFRKKRGRLPLNQKKDLIKDVRGLLRVLWDDNEKLNLEQLNKIKNILEEEEQ